MPETLPHVAKLKSMLRHALDGRSLGVLEDWEVFENSDSVAIVVSVYNAKKYYADEF